MVLLPSSPHRIRIFTIMPAPAVQSPIFNVTSNPRIVPVVLPPSADLSLSGRIRNIQIRGADHSGWLTGDGRGGWALKPEYSNQGYRLLRDYYISEGNQDGWEMYQRYIRDWQAKKTSKPFPFHLLPKEVQAMQQGQVAPEYADPWNLPAPAPTTGVVSEGPKPKKSKPVEE